ncbi:putative Glycosyltransferase [Candidatus Promineifilum breve]|uniref:Glycosyltransferase n=1 Tax=Candidatus Promineifilum breve TaxID=1806508 RepID=A0A160T7Z7_9CHLR|nr:glycosyltransferase family 4 protein [Candidatus Promineifilum breve]CUS05030.2 putative Glycosyltransferase [Candidatus Promineifilum breve]
MKVLLVSYLMDVRVGGGAAIAAMHLAQGLTRQGIEVVAVTTHDKPEPQVATGDDGIKIYSFRPRNLYWVKNKDAQPIWKRVIWQTIDIWNPSTFRMMRRLIRQEQPDVIHVHKLRGISPAVWSAAAAEDSRPIIQTCHDYELISPEGLLQSTIGRMAQRRHWALRPYQMMRARYSRQVNVATFPSRFNQQIITGMGFFDRARQFVVPNTHGLSTRELDSLPVGLPADSASFRLLYLGRLEREKGIDVLCQAFAGLMSEMPQLHLDIAGTGTSEAALRATYAGVPRMRFHGYVSGAEKDRLISQSDALVMPSIVHEVFGISIIEAYAYGKPVIAANIGGMPELIIEGETGFLVEPGQVESLQQKIRQMVAEPEKRSRMSWACREKARSYSLEAVTSAYLTAYEAGLGSGVGSQFADGPTQQAQPDVRI